MQTIDQAARAGAGPDPLGVLSSCATVVNDSIHVSIYTTTIQSFVETVIEESVPPPAWDVATHFQGFGPEATEQTIGWIFALDALNFCFWGQADDPSDRWRIESGGVTHDGYMALAIALRDAARAGIPIWDPGWQAAVDEPALERILGPAPGSAAIPLMPERVTNLRELGAGMQAFERGSRPYGAFVAAAGSSAPRLVQAIVDTFPSFRDVARWTPAGGEGPSIEVRFLKRAQILVSDLAAALADAPDVAIANRDQLTAFADYKVPQVLRHFGMLAYDDDLAGRIRKRTAIAAGSREEIEIRAATIWGCELIRQELDRHGGRFTASDVDWLLWNAGQSLPADHEPYHRTVTMFY
jgi:hypothetical protein